MVNSKPLLFNDFERTDHSPASLTESYYSFLNRISTPYWVTIRQLLESWMVYLPNSISGDIIGRMKSGDDKDFLGAFWETYLYIISKNLNFETTVHPNIHESPNRPDFMLDLKGKYYILEATALSTPNKTSQYKIWDQIYDFINEIDSPYFFLNLELICAGTEQPSISKSLSKLESKLKLLGSSNEDEQELKKISDDFICYICDRGWKIKITITYKNRLRGKKTRPIGVSTLGLGLGISNSNDWRAIFFKALNKKKASRYGKLSNPYIIAILLDNHYPCDYIVMDALFGNHQINIPGTDPNRRWSSNEQSCFWRESYGHNNSVSAVVVAHRLKPSSIVKSEPIIWHNPWALYPISDNVFPWRSYRLDSQNTLHMTEPRMRTYKILGLDEDWPGPEDPLMVE